MLTPEQQELKTKWLEALRSGKYQQGQGLLRQGNKYCCLGVLAEINGEHWNQFGRSYSIDGVFGQSVYMYKGPFADAFSEILDNAAEMNDQGIPFEEIASYLERELE